MLRRATTGLAVILLAAACRERSAPPHEEAASAASSSAPHDSTTRLAAASTRPRESSGARAEVRPGARPEAPSDVPHRAPNAAPHRAQSDAPHPAPNTAPLSAPNDRSPAAPLAAPPAAPPASPRAALPAANELGRIPVFQYHLVGDSASRWSRQRDQFRRDLQLLYDRGYRPVTIAELVDRKVDLPAGRSPVVITFDDASPSQFRYVERSGSLVVDSTSALGIWLDFGRTRPEWRNRATFCLLSGAEAGRSFFGNKDIEGQKTEWRFRKLQFLAAQGFELCNHTLWHANLAKYPDQMVQEQIARGVMAIDSAVPGYRVRTLALPYGVWPKNRALARSGSWRDPKSGRVVRYDFDAVLEVAGTATPSPYDPRFNAFEIERIQAVGDAVSRTLDALERSGQRYVSDGNPRSVARSPAPAAPLRGGRR